MRENQVRGSEEGEARSALDIRRSAKEGKPSSRFSVKGKRENHVRRLALEVRRREGDHVRSSKVLLVTDY
jgi:hypothetical protein